MKKVALVLSIGMMVLLSACGSTHAGNKASNSSGGHNSSSGNSNQTSSHKGGNSGGSGASTAGVCGDLTAAKSWVKNLQSLGSNPSMSTLTSDLKTLDTKLQTAGKAAPAILKTSFTGVETADTSMQSSISQLQSSGAPSSTYEQPIKSGVAAIGTAFDALVAASKCA